MTLNKVLRVVAFLPHHPPLTSFLHGQEKEPSLENSTTAISTEKQFTYPFTETYHGPQGKAQTTATAKAATDKPLYIDGQSFL